MNRSLCFGCKRFVQHIIKKKRTPTTHARRYLSAGAATEDSRKNYNDAEGSRSERFFDSFKSLLLDVIRFFGCFHIITKYVCGITFCIGPSMLPTLREKGDLVFIDKWSHSVLQIPYQRGDVVICTCPYDTEKTVCKRIRAVAGDDIPKDSIFSDILSSFYPNTVNKVPPGHVWLAGDNASNSNDSRNYGPVPLPLLRGRVIMKINNQNPYITLMTNVINKKDRNCP